MIQEIRELRVNIDGLAQLTKSLNPVSLTEFEKIKNPELIAINQKTIEKTVDSLYLAKAWLGKILGELGTENPYKSGYKTKEDTESTADVAKKIKDFPLDNRKWGDNINKVSHIEKVDWLREEINKLQKLWDSTIAEKIDTSNKYSWQVRDLISFFVQHLSEARFWLEFELERIKNEK